MTKPIIGILGGGQLGMMLCDSAKEIDIETHVFCQMMIVHLKEDQHILVLGNTLMKRK